MSGRSSRGERNPPQEEQNPPQQQQNPPQQQQNPPQQEQNPPQQERRTVVVYDPDTQTIAKVEVSADGGEIRDHWSQEVNSTWNGKIYVYWNPTPATQTEYRISDSPLLENSNLRWIVTIDVNEHWRRGTERTLYIGPIPDPAPVPTRS